MMLRFALTAVLLGAASAAAAQQQQPFVFSVSTAPSDRNYAAVHLDTGVGSGSFDSMDTEGFVQRFGVQAAVGARVTLLGRLGIASSDRDAGTMEEGELLYSVLRSPATRGSVAVGMGLRHELGGTNVLLSRVAAGRTFSAWRADGNALFEAPLAAPGRDAVDLIVSAGFARQLTPMLHAGVEMIGEDLEGFWNPAEAEGGAHLLVGPSVRVSPASTKWQVSAAGGPMFYGSHSRAASSAERALPLGSGRTEFALRVSLAYTF